LQLNKEIQALFQLIDDPDNEVFETVAHQLLQYGKEIVPSLEYLWESAEEENVQERIALLIHRVHFKELQKELSDWCDAEQPELLRGAIIVAQYQYPELNIPFLLTQFEQMRDMMKKMQGGGLMKMMKKMGGMKGMKGMMPPGFGGG
jgi:HEAT repeat protein